MSRRPTDAEFADFVHRSWPGLYRTARMLMGEHELAEDLVQTALASTYASWGRIREPQAAFGYAKTTLVNTAGSWFRRKSWHNELPSVAVPERSAEHDQSLRLRLQDALAALAPRQRAVIVLRFYEDLSVAETAAALGCSTGTVKSQTSDALARLRPLLGDSVIPATLGVDHD